MSLPSTAMPRVCAAKWKRYFRANGESVAPQSPALRVDQDRIDTVTGVAACGAACGRCRLTHWPDTPRICAPHPDRVVMERREFIKLCAAAGTLGANPAFAAADLKPRFYARVRLGGESRRAPAAAKPPRRPPFN